MVKNAKKLSIAVKTYVGSAVVRGGSSGAIATLGFRKVHFIQFNS